MTIATNFKNHYFFILEFGIFSYEFDWIVL